MPRREKQGTVVSDKMNKTRVVAVVDREPHPRYHKIHLQTIRFKAHDENNETRVGDVVRIVESRPMSRDKRWTVVEVVKKAEEI